MIDGDAGALAGLRTRPNRAAALEYYDGLPAVTCEELLGSWRGSGLPTGHPLDGLLERFGWYGKRFDGVDAAHPLLVTTRAGRLVAIDPRWVPLGLVVRRPGLAHLPVAVPVFRVVRSLLVTRQPRARLRMTAYRGVVTATMCYDALPIHDAFRRVDATTLLGAMDLRGSAHPFLFVLTREQRA